MPLVLAALLGVVVGVVSAFQALRTVHGIWVGVGFAVIAAAALSFGLARATRASGAPVAATVGWMAAVLYLSTGRPEGDVVVPGSGQGYAFLLLGVLALALGIRAGARARERFTSEPQEPKTLL